MIVFKQSIHHEVTTVLLIPESSQPVEIYLKFPSKQGEFSMPHLLVQHFFPSRVYLAYLEGTLHFLRMQQTLLAILTVTFLGFGMFTSQVPRTKGCQGHLQRSGINLNSNKLTNHLTYTSHPAFSISL